ncbi:hypothetical protein SDC9_130839 [bioreactor metagenome]|uniref:Uncharacterized protein n=1 Tax=bioreactor metagenome TaxID=1076179 RepID=A0A645D2R8_9ZZZZ
MYQLIQSGIQHVANQTFSIILNDISQIVFLFERSIVVLVKNKKLHIGKFFIFFNNNYRFLVVINRIIYSFFRISWCGYV